MDFVLLAGRADLAAGGRRSSEHRDHGRLTPPGGAPARARRADEDGARALPSPAARLIAVAATLTETTHEKVSPGWTPGYTIVNDLGR